MNGIQVKHVFIYSSVTAEKSRLGKYVESRRSKKLGGNYKVEGRKVEDRRIW